MNRKSNFRTLPPSYYPLYLVLCLALSSLAFAEIQETALEKLRTRLDTACGFTPAPVGMTKDGVRNQLIASCTTDGEPVSGLLDRFCSFRQNRMAVVPRADLVVASIPVIKPLLKRCGGQFTGEMLQAKIQGRLQAFFEGVKARIRAAIDAMLAANNGRFHVQIDSSVERSVSETIARSFKSCVMNAYYAIPLEPYRTLEILLPLRRQLDLTPPGGARNSQAVKDTLTKDLLRSCAIQAFADNRSLLQLSMPTSSLETGEEKKLGAFSASLSSLFTSAGALYLNVSPFQTVFTEMIDEISLTTCRKEVQGPFVVGFVRKVARVSFLFTVALQRRFDELRALPTFMFIFGHILNRVEDMIQHALQNFPELVERREEHVDEEVTTSPLVCSKIADLIKNQVIIQQAPAYTEMRDNMVNNSMTALIEAMQKVALQKNGIPVSVVPYLDGQRADQKSLIMTLTDTVTGTTAVIYSDSEGLDKDALLGVLYLAFAPEKNRDPGIFGSAIGEALLTGGTQGSGAFASKIFRSFLGRNGGLDASGESILNGSKGYEDYLVMVLGSEEYFLRNQTDDETGKQRFIAALTRDLLGRDADAAGINNWVNAIPSLGRDGVVRGFINSEEFRRNLIGFLYKNGLMRASSPAESEVQAWLGQFNQGKSIKEVVFGFTVSQEYANRLADLKYRNPENFKIGRILLNGGLNGPDALISGMYSSFLGRAADAGAYPGWRPTVTGSFGFENFTIGILASQEYFDRNRGTGDANRNWVASLYRNLLNREPDPGGLDAWTAVVPTAGRAGVVFGFVYSQEFRRNIIKYLYAGALLRPNPASNGEVDAWVNWWNTGAQITHVLGGFTNSQEFWAVRAKGI